jgi:hypothetical protein
VHLYERNNRQALITSIPCVLLQHLACVCMFPGNKPSSAPGHSPSSSGLQDILVAGALPSLLPYKLVHAQMLAEHGRISDALAYCQVSLQVHTSSAIRY